jgi:hypothetical protein
LIHHHPFSYDTEPKGMLQSFLSKISGADDIYLRLDGAEEFIEWCQRMRVQLILHGHKHIPKYFVKHGISTIAAVGCGSTMGIDLTDLSYVTVTVDNRTNRYSVAFYRGRRDGSGFEEEAMAVKTVE